MKFLKQFLILLILGCITNSINILANTITGVQLTKNSKGNLIVINFDQKYLGFPEIEYKQNSILLNLKNVKTRVLGDRNYKIALHDNDLSVSPVEKNQDTLITLTFNHLKSLSKEKTLSLELGESSIRLIFNQNLIAQIENSKKTPVVAKIKEVKKASEKNTNNESIKLNLDEKYLDKLLKKDFAKSEDNKKTIVADKVSESLSSFKKNTNSVSSSFDVKDYLGKIVAFIALILVVFYGLVLIFKKGFLKKGNLSFLKNGTGIQVLNTTYISPKKSLLLIRVNDQVFLVGSTDNSMNLISEINSASSVLKTTERDLSGSNFDTEFETKDKKNKELKIKEDIYQSSNGLLQDLFRNKKEIKAESDDVKVELSSLKEEINSIKTAKKEDFDSNLESKQIPRFAHKLKEKVSKLKPLEG